MSKLLRYIFNKNSYLSQVAHAILLLICSLSLFSCTTQNREVTPLNTFTAVSFTNTPEVVSATIQLNYENGCIPPLEDVVYSNELNSSKPVPGKDLIVSPLTPWKEVSTLPEQWLGWGEQFSRTINGQIEIWILNPLNWDNNPNDVLRSFAFLIYKPDSREWKKVSAVISDSNVSVGKLFVAKDGSLWGASGGTNMLSSVDASSPLAKYNEQTEKFEFVKEASNIPSGRTEPKGIYAYPYWDTVLQDTNGVFWIFAHKNGVYRFDPLTNQSEKYLDTPNTIFVDAAISASGDIYFEEQNAAPANSLNDLKIFNFDITNKSLERVGINLEPWPRYFTGMLVDQKDRLWLGSSGFRTSDGSWYQIHRSPIFIVNKFEDNSSYRWLPPKLMFESFDDRFWFNSLNGTAWLDLEQEKWCWFTTYQSNIVEDSDRNLWMIADNKLYKLPLGEQ